MILLSYTLRRNFGSENYNHDFSVSTLAQKYSKLSLDDAVLRFFMHYGTALIQAIDEVLYDYLDNSVKHVLSKFDTYSEDTTINVKNLFITDYLMIFQELRNIALNQKHFVKEYVSLIDTYNINLKTTKDVDSEIDSIIAHYKTKFNNAEIRFTKSISKDTVVVEVKVRYENPNIDMHIENLKILYAKIVSRTKQIYQIYKTQEKLYDNIEKLESVDLVKMIDKVSDLRKRVERLEKALLLKSIMTKQELEDKEKLKKLNEMLREITEKANKINEMLFNEKQDVKSIEDAKQVSRKSKNFISRMYEKAKEIKDKIKQKVDNALSKIRNFFRPKNRGPRL